MFDARSILDALVRGGGQAPRGSEPSSAGDIFRDLLGQLAGGDQSRVPPPQPDRAPSGRPPRGGAHEPDEDEAPSPRDAASGQEEDGETETDEDEGEQDATDARPGAPGPQTGGQSLEDLLRRVLGGGREPGAGGGPGGGLQDILRDILGGGQPGQANRMFGEGAPGGGAGAGALLETLRQALGQATSGVREGAGRLDEMTGASGRARDALGQATGQSPDELIAKLKELIANNQLGTGAALGGLGALILGTGAGRSLAASAAKLGSLALIGGLAYKA